MANQVSKVQWNKKVDIYIYENRVKKHLCRPNLLWCYVRDISPSEQATYDQFNNYTNVSTVMYINYNSTILALWQQGNKRDEKNPVWANVNGRTYKVVTKPDEYDHNKGDIKIVMEEQLDQNQYDSEEWQA